MAICPLPFSHSLNRSLAFDGMVTRRLDRVVGRKNGLKMLPFSPLPRFDSRHRPCIGLLNGSAYHKPDRKRAAGCLFVISPLFTPPHHFSLSFLFCVVELSTRHKREFCMFLVVSLLLVPYERKSKEPGSERIPPPSS